MPGAAAGMCGSLANRGLPETVRLPETTQLLLACGFSMSGGERPMRARACCSLSIEFCSWAKMPRLKEIVFKPLWSCALAGNRSWPTTRTSRGEVSGSNALHFSFGKLASDARMISNCHVEDRYSANSLPTASESDGVQWRGLYCKRRNSGGSVLSVSESMKALTPFP